jgi:hypothetical protein
MRPIHRVCDAGPAQLHRKMRGVGVGVACAWNGAGAGISCGSAPAVGTAAGGGGGDASGLGAGMICARATADRLGPLSAVRNNAANNRVAIAPVEARIPYQSPVRSGTMVRAVARTPPGLLIIIAAQSARCKRLEHDRKRTRFSRRRECHKQRTLLFSISVELQGGPIKCS